MFELSISARKAAKDVALSYKTALKAFDLLRRVLVEDLARSDALLKGELEADESYFGGGYKKELALKSLIIHLADLLVYLFTL